MAPHGQAIAPARTEATLSRTLRCRLLLRELPARVGSRFLREEAGTPGRRRVPLQMLLIETEPRGKDGAAANLAAASAGRVRVAPS